MVSSGSSLEERMKPVTTAAAGVSTSTEGEDPPAFIEEKKDYVTE